jgi:formiminoglutamate deiminase
MLWFAAALTDEGWISGLRVELRDGRIDSVARSDRPVAGDDIHGAAISGLANLHSHAFQRGMAGLAETRGPDNDNFWTWREVMYRFLDRLGPDDVEAIAALAYVEMLERGFTRVGEFHYLHRRPDGGDYADVAELAVRIASAAGRTGIGLTLLPVFYAHANFGGAPPTPGQRRFLSDLDGFATLFEASRGAISSLPDAVLGVAPHSLRAVRPDELSRIAALAPEGPIHIHAAEQMKEVEECLAWSGQRPVAWLLDHVGIDRRWCLVHATHLDTDECSRLASSGAVAGLCPITEANLGDGTFPAREHFVAGGRFGLGTDSNVLIDAAGELRALEYAQRLFHQGRNVLAAGPGQSTGRALWAGALEGGARALGVQPPALRTGAAADIITFDFERPEFCGRSGDAILDTWIFAGGPVDTVWCRGQKRVSGGRHIDGERIRREFSICMRKLLA